MIHPYDDGTFGIASKGCWLPGTYDSESTARWAFKFSNVDLERLSDRVCRFDGENRAITSEDLRELRKTHTGNEGASS